MLKVLNTITKFGECDVMKGGKHSVTLCHVLLWKRKCCGSLKVNCGALATVFIIH